MNEISCYIYEYIPATDLLQVTNSVVKNENEVGYEVAYSDPDKFKTDYLSGRLEFTARPDESQESLRGKIQASVDSTGVKALQESTLVTGQSPEDLNAPAPTEGVIAKKINKTTAIRMKNADKDVDWFNPSQLAEKVELGWIPTRGEFINYPILTEDDKVKWTINVSELNALFAENQKIYIYDVNKLIDADEFRAMFPNKEYPANIIVVSDTTSEAAPETLEQAPAEPEPQPAMPEVPEGVAEVPQV